MKKFLLHLVAAFGIAFFPFLTFAQLSGGDTGLSATVEEGYKVTSIMSIQEFVGAYIIRPILGIVGTLLFVLMAYAGFLWLTAQGESKKVQKAKDILTQCIVGTVILVGAYALANFVVTSLSAGSGT